MSYLVLARKYRPRDFSEMLGQAHVVQALGNALTQGRLHHAWMFSGTRGVGKTTVSRILAKSLNCLGADGAGGITAAPCGQCTACREIDSGRFVDYTELDAASHRGVDEVQALLEQAVYKPVQGRFKVFMIDEVHMLSNTAFNAMLKTLEEPPEYLKFILATTDPQKVPVTVLSRCLQFHLRPMPPATIAAHLAQVLEKEGVAFDARALRLLARAAHGSMRDALSLTDQAIAFGGGCVQEGGVRQMLGSVDSGHVFALIEALARGHGRDVVEGIEALRRQGLSAAATLEDMCAALHRMAVYQAIPGAPDDDDDLDAATLAQLARLLPRDETQLLYSICLRALDELGLAPDEYAALTMALLRLLVFQPPRPAGDDPELPSPSPPPENRQPPAPETVPVPPAQEPPAQAGAAESVAPPPLEPLDLPAPAAQQETQQEAPPQTLPPELPPLPAGEGPPHDPGALWHATVQRLAQQKTLQHLSLQLARQSQLVQCAADGAWQLRCANLSLVQNRAVCEGLRQALIESGCAQQLHVEHGPAQDTPQQRAARAQDALLARAREQVEGHPLVQALVRDQGAKIVPGSIQPLRQAAA